jgi:hypothetical protein
VDTDEVVPEGIQRNHIFVILQLLEEAFVNRVNRCMLIRIVRFARSVYLVEMCRGSGLPVILSLRIPAQPVGL